MTADRESAPSAHIPVMLAEVMAELAPKPGERIVDATFGGGGYTRAILGAGAQVIGIDRDRRPLPAVRRP